MGLERENLITIDITKKDLDLINLIKNNPQIYEYIYGNMKSWIKKERKIIKRDI